MAEESSLLQSFALALELADSRLITDCRVRAVHAVFVTCKILLVPMVFTKPMMRNDNQRNLLRAIYAPVESKIEINNNFQHIHFGVCVCLWE